MAGSEIDTGQPPLEAPDDGLLQIGELADRVGLSLRTVRYYEEMGLVTPERRTDGGFRLFTQTHVDRLLMIKRMKPIGFSIQEMGQVLDARDTLQDTAADAAARADARGRLAEFAQLADARYRKTAARLEQSADLPRILDAESTAP
jgi:DNA-binding transcriptional MerR regulator